MKAGRGGARRRQATSAHKILIVRDSGLVQMLRRKGGVRSGPRRCRGSTRDLYGLATPLVSPLTSASSPSMNSIQRLSRLISRATIAFLIGATSATLSVARRRRASSGGSRGMAATRPTDVDHGQPQQCAPASRTHCTVAGFARCRSADQARAGEPHHTVARQCASLSGPGLRVRFQGQPTLKPSFRRFSQNTLAIRTPAASTLSQRLSAILSCLNARSQPALLIFDTFEAAGDAEQW